MCIRRRSKIIVLRLAATIDCQISLVFLRFSHINADSLDVNRCHLPLRLFIASVLAFAGLRSAAVFADRSPKECALLFKRDPTVALIHEQNSKLHTSPEVERAVRTSKAKIGARLEKPADKLQYWLERLESTYRHARGSEKGTEVIRNDYLERFVTKRADVPEGFFELQVRIAREQGRTLVLTAAERDHIAEIAIKDQRASLANWIDFFLSPEADLYPMWAKYWSFQSVLKMGKYDPETGLFAARSKGQMSLFSDLNGEAFALVIDQMGKMLRKEKLQDLDDPALAKSFETKSFSRIYGQALKYLASQKRAAESVDGLRGEWVKYPRGSDPGPLIKSIENRSTGWCTAGENTARGQLERGDFYVYYSFDHEGRPVNPRVAIRMQGDQVKEVRGVARNQNLDSEIVTSSIVDRKLAEFGREGEAYRKKSADMRMITDLEKKTERGEMLSDDEIRFLYEIDLKIESFGEHQDERIFYLRPKRNTKSDLAQIFHCRPDQISLTAEEAIKGDIVFHYGDLNLLHFKSAKGLTLPKSIGGNLSLVNLTSARELILPESIKGKLDLSGLLSARGLKFSKSVGGDVLLGNLTSAEGMPLFEATRAFLRKSGLISAKALELPESVGGDLFLGRLTSAEGLALPKSIGGDLYLHGLTSAKGLELPESIGGKLWFSSRLAGRERIDFTRCRLSQGVEYFQ